MSISHVAAIPSADELVSEYQLHAPVRGQCSDVYALKFAGWVVGRHSPVKAIEIVESGQTIRTVPVRISRPDVAQRHPRISAADRCGFWGLAGTIGLPPEFALQVRAVFDNGGSAPLTEVRGKRARLHTGFEPTIQPLMVTSLGRSGTTWLMKLLSECPQIVMYRHYPYEMRASRYWMHMLKVLAEPANHETSARADSFAENLNWTGHNPNYTGAIADDPRLGQWLGHTYPEQIGEFCQKCTEGFYRQAALAQNRSAPLYFAEKQLPDHVPNITWELYPQAREIILVRDFRDTVCSMLSFNRKRGYAAFGRECTTTDEQFVREVGLRARRLAAAWHSRAATALMVRYEDLVAEPVLSLCRVLRYLMLDADAALAERMLEAESRDTSEATRHRTSDGAVDSVGRWRKELGRELQSACDDAFRDVLPVFGYPTTSSESATAIDNQSECPATPPGAGGLPAIA
jgi:hypothetical protein